MATDPNAKLKARIEATLLLSILTAAGLCGLLGTLRVGVMAGLACGFFGALLGAAAGVLASLAMAHYHLRGGSDGTR